MLLPKPLRLHRRIVRPALIFGVAVGAAVTQMPLSGASEAVADHSAAAIDWRPRDQLPRAQRDALPAFCSGGYLQPEAADESSRDNGAGGSVIEASALSARYEMDAELYLKGDVRFAQGDIQLTGDEARYNQRSGQVALSGDLVTRGGGVLLTGDEASYDVNTGYFDLNDATYLLHAAEMRGRADRLHRTGTQELTIEGGYLTTCAPDQNDWSIVASDIRLNQAEGFGTARHVRLQVKDVPVFYWPWASFPIDDRRKSGFLYPSIGSSSADSGLAIAAPYYFNIAPHYDATLTPQYINGRGLFTEAEGRYLSRWGQSVLQLGYIDRDSDYRREYPGESGERWALDFSTRARFGGGWRGYGDYSVVSDNDYLSDLNLSLDIGRATHLERRGGVSYQDQWQWFEAYAAGYQTITDTVTDQDRPYSQLPELWYEATVPAGPLELGLASQYTWFYRDNTGLTGLDRANGQRIRVEPELALPLRATWGYSRPSVTLDHTWYELDDYDPGSSSFDRTVPVFEWDNGLYFDRPTELLGRAWNQSLEPRLYYARADAPADQDQIPDFDAGLRSFSFDNLFRRNRFTGGDRVADANQLTVALTSRFNDMATGAERARLSLGQVYFYDDREVTLDGLGAERRSDSPLAGELALRPVDGLDLRYSTLWDPRESQTEEARTQLMFHSPDYRYLAMLGHSYRRNEFEQMDIGAVVPVTDSVSLIGRWVYDSQLDRTAGTLAGIEYNSCCWSLQLVGQSILTDDQELDHRILFQIQLKGIGGSGGTASTLSDAFYGYDERERRRFRSRP